MPGPLRGSGPGMARPLQDNILPFSIVYSHTTFSLRHSCDPTDR